MTYLQDLAQAARPLNEADWGSERQVAAESDFFDTLDLQLANLPLETLEAFDAFCAKATSDEMITEGLRLAGLVLQA